jgi:hypothetical protein
MTSPDDHLVALLGEREDLLLVAALGEALEEERRHLAFKLAAGPALPGCLNLIESARRGFSTRMRTR